MINFGKYDRKIVFKTFGNSPDGYGGIDPVFVYVLMTFARAIQDRGTNRLEAGVLELPKTYTFGVQYRANFEPNTNYTIEYDGYNHTILGVRLNQERQRKEWIITTEKGKALTNLDEVALLESGIEVGI
jgi:SPP1 family predicted phage head-tail adaptor